jgi:putative transposase
VFWVGDITYLATKAGWVYLVVLIDLFSRRVVGWSLQEHLQTRLCLQVLHQAVVTRPPGPVSPPRSTPPSMIPMAPTA